MATASTFLPQPPPPPKKRPLEQQENGSLEVRVRKYLAHELSNEHLERATVSMISSLPTASSSLPKSERPDGDELQARLAVLKGVTEFLERVVSNVPSL